jgi:CDP-glucose 4,6-dehydratase
MAEVTSPWRGRRVLVTGCTGFLGGAVARELFARGADVVGLVNERPAADIFGPDQGGRVHLVRGRTDNVFRLHSAMAVHEVAAVFHLAAHDPFGEDRGTGAVLQAAKLYSRRVPVVTARPLQQLTLARTEERDDRLRVARFGEVFGPGDRKLFRVVPATALGLITGDATTPPDGPARDFVFVRDAARACLLAAEAAPGDYIFRSGNLLTDRQMCAAVRAVYACNPVEVPDAAPVSNPLGWAPQQPLAEALEETLAWYRAFLQAGCAVPVRAAA